MEERGSRDHLLRDFLVSLHEEKGDKFVLLFECAAEDADHAADQAADMYPGCEVLNCTDRGPWVAPAMPEQEKEPVSYVVVDEEAIGYTMKEVGCCVVLAAKSKESFGENGIVSTAGKSVREATVNDFQEYEVSLKGKFLVYSANEAAISDDGDGFWNNELGFCRLEDATVFTADFSSVCGPQKMPFSLGEDAKLVASELFLRDGEGEKSDD